VARLPLGALVELRRDRADSGRHAGDRGYISCIADGAGSGTYEVEWEAPASPPRDPRATTAEPEPAQRADEPLVTGEELRLVALERDVSIEEYEAHILAEHQCAAFHLKTVLPRRPPGGDPVFWAETMPAVHVFADGSDLRSPRWYAFRVAAEGSTPRIVVMPHGGRVLDAHSAAQTFAIADANARSQPRRS
jgi:hypothetical protein